MTLLSLQGVRPAKADDDEEQDAGRRNGFAGPPRSVQEQERRKQERRHRQRSREPTTGAQGDRAGPDQEEKQPFDQVVPHRSQPIRALGQRAQAAQQIQRSPCPNEASAHFCR
jgi:hypothetical protein